MKKIMFSLIILSMAFTLGQNKMYIWKNSAITDSMDITNDLKISFKSASPIPTEGLVAWYPFNGNANDESGNGNNGILSTNPPTLTTNRFNTANKAYSFNGSNNYIKTSLDVQPSAIPVTSWSFWVKPKRINHNVRQQFLSGDDGTCDRTIGIEKYTADWMVFIGDIGTGTWTPISAQITTDSWYHIVVIYTVTDVYFYLNNNKFLRGSAATGQTSLNKFHIGANPLEGISEYSEADIDDVRIYNRALSDSEIQALYQEK